MATIDTTIELRRTVRNLTDHVRSISDMVTDYAGHIERSLQAELALSADCCDTCKQVSQDRIAVLQCVYTDALVMLEHINKTWPQ